MNTLAPTLIHRPNWLVLVAFLVIVFGVGGTIGVLTAPGEWYAGLSKPPFNPPNWVFGPVWGLLYILIAFAGWRAFSEAPTGTAMRLWSVQMLLNWLWSPTWFALHLIWPAFAIITAIWVLIALFIAERWRRDRASALAFLPYFAWVSFAGLLNLSIAILN